jgi:hypothetical protein
MSTWTYLGIAAMLKVPTMGFVYWVWRTLRDPQEQPAPASEDGGGGSKARHDPHPRPRVPRSPRRGPHGAAPAPAPARVRSVNARACSVGH